MITTLWITLLVAAVEKTGRGDGRLFYLADPERNRELLVAAGFSEVRIGEIAEPRRYEDFDQDWHRHTQPTGPVAAWSRRSPPARSSPSERRCNRAGAGAAGPAGRQASR